MPAEVRRTAQIQVEDIATDRTTLRLGLRGDLVLANDSEAVRVVLDGSVASASSLRLRLIHPGHADLDRDVTLIASGEAWHGRLPVGTHAWNIELSPPDGAWRLAGRLDPGTTRVALRPRLAE